MELACLAKILELTLREASSCVNSSLFSLPLLLRRVNARFDVLDVYRGGLKEIAEVLAMSIILKRSGRRVASPSSREASLAFSTR